MRERERCPREPSVFIHKIFHFWMFVNDIIILFLERKSGKEDDIRLSKSKFDTRDARCKKPFYVSLT
jgi:hypothetical protein